MDLKSVQSYLERDMQLMQSDHADLTEDKWTFTAVNFKATAGDHLIIAKRDWEQLWRALRITSESTSASDEKDCACPGGQAEHLNSCVYCR